MTQTAIPAKNRPVHPLLRLMQRNQNTIIIYVVLVVVIIGSSFASDVFLSPRNFPNIMKQSAALALVSIGQLFVLLIAGIDLSVGSTISVVVVIMAAIMKPTPDSMILITLLGLAIGTSVGILNGLLITRLKLAPFMVTLATLSIGQGLALQLTTNPRSTIPREYSPIFTDNTGFFTGEKDGIPIPFLIIIGAAVLAWILLSYTRIGRHIYAVGSNENATRLSGLHTDRIKLIAYTLCGFMTGAASIFMAAKTRAGDPYIGGDFAFDSITAVVLGGASLSGGVGSVWGTIAGVFILTILSNILNLANVPANYQYILKGALLVMAVMLYRIRR